MPQIEVFMIYLTGFLGGFLIALVVVNVHNELLLLRRRDLDE